MTTTFGSVDDAKECIASMTGAELSSFEEVPNLCVGGMETMLLDSPSVSKEVKASIQARLDAQKGFKLVTPKGQEVQIAIGPFRDGFDCWIVQKNGMAHRI